MRQEKEEKQRINEDIRESLDHPVIPFKPILRTRATVFDQAKALLQAHGIVFDKDANQLPGVIGELKALSKFWALCTVYFGRERFLIEWTVIDRKKNIPRQLQQTIANYELGHFRFLR